MSGLPFGLVVEGSVAILLMVTIGYCFILNIRLKRLHSDRDAMRVMITDLVHATKLANGAIQELKATAVEADLSLTSRLEEAERFGVELAAHIHAGQSVMTKIIKITNAVRIGEQRAAEALGQASPEAKPGKARSALAHLVQHNQQVSENAA